MDILWDWWVTQTTQVSCSLGLSTCSMYADYLQLAALLWLVLSQHCHHWLCHPCHYSVCHSSQPCCQLSCPQHSLQWACLCPQIVQRRNFNLECWLACSTVWIHLRHQCWPFSIDKNAWASHFQPYLVSFTFSSCLDTFWQFVACF